MPQTIILATGQSAANAADVTILAGGSATFSIRCTDADGIIPPNIIIPIKLVRNGTVKTEAHMMSTRQTEVVGAPGVWRCSRADISAYGKNIEITVDV